MIVFYLSPKEYEFPKRHRKYGARVSDLARLAVERLASRSDTQDNLAAALQEIDDRLHNLESQVLVLIKKNIAS